MPQPQAAGAAEVHVLDSKSLSWSGFVCRGVSLDNAAQMPVPILDATEAAGVRANAGRAMGVRESGEGSSGEMVVVSE